MLFRSSEYKGYSLFFVRSWVSTQDGMIPTRKGISLPIDLLPQIIEALQATLEHVRKVEAHRDESDT